LKILRFYSYFTYKPITSFIIWQFSLQYFVYFIQLELISNSHSQKFDDFIRISVIQWHNNITMISFRIITFQIILLELIPIVHFRKFKNFILVSFHLNSMISFKILPFQKTSQFPSTLTYWNLSVTKFIFMTQSTIPSKIFNFQII
jgi:hypothetical protein